MFNFQFPGWKQRLSNTLPLRCKLTNECEQLVSHTISHASIKHEYTQVMHCLHASQNSRTLNSRYLQTNTRVLANELASTRKRTREYSQSLTSVTTFVGMLRNRFNELWCTWYEEMRSHASSQGIQCMGVSEILQPSFVVQVGLSLRQYHELLQQTNLAHADHKTST